jgi:hypothetical protein
MGSAASSTTAASKSTPMSSSRKNALFAGSDEGASYCSSDHPLTNAAVFVGDYQAADVASAV